MFLALKELKYSKSKFILIMAVIFLISYLVYFLTSLANGLATSYTNSINKWNSKEIVITVDSNDNMMMSYMNNDDFDNNVAKAVKLLEFTGAGLTKSEFDFLSEDIKNITFFLIKFLFILNYAI